MTDVAALIADMVKAGVDADIIGRTAAALAEREIVHIANEPKRSAGAERQARYRARGGDNIPLDLRNAVLDRDDFTCQDCGSIEHLQIDHIHPVSKGGETTLENLQVLCRPCNARKKDRIRKAIPRNSAETRLISAEFQDEVSPKKETSPAPPKEKTTPSQSEANASSKTPRAALETVLDAKRAEQVLAHRQRIRKPLTTRAAELLAGQFAACPDPNAAADAMVLNGWQGFKPEWMERQQSRGSPPQTNRPQTASEILRNRRIQGNQTDDDRTAGTPRLVAIGHVS